jgi:hypothetical protein
MQSAVSTAEQLEFAGNKGDGSIAQATLRIRNLTSLNVAQSDVFMYDTRKYFFISRELLDGNLWNLVWPFCRL